MYFSLVLRNNKKLNGQKERLEKDIVAMKKEMATFDQDYFNGISQGATNDEILKVSKLA